MDTTDILLVVVAVLLGIVVGQVAGILAVVSGLALAQAFVAGGVAFATTVPLVLVVKNELTK